MRKPNCYPVLIALNLCLLDSHGTDTGQDPSPGQGQDDLPKPVSTDAEGEYRSGYADVPQFGGPGSVASELKEEDRGTLPWLRFPGLDRALQPWFEAKQHIQRDYGLAFGMDYSTVYLAASQSNGEDQAASGMARFYGSWTLLDRQGDSPGSLVYKVEHRHRIGTEIPPSGLGFEAGYLGLIEPPFSNQGWRLTNLYWQQKTLGGKLNFLVGWLDTTDYLNVYALANPWSQFMNLEFSTGTTIGIPNEGLGTAIGGMMTDHVYGVAGIADANSDPAHPDEGFDTFFNDQEYFHHVELGWTTSFERRYLDNVHVTAWHVDEREAAQVPDSWGVNFSASRFVDDFWLPFLRAGYAEGNAPLLQASVHTGVGFYFKAQQDLLAITTGWGKPADNALDDQFTTELFYRFQLTQNLAVTPDIQLIVDPALNPDEDVLAILGVRGRITF